jgi:HSP20 family protein
MTGGRGSERRAGGPTVRYRRVRYRHIVTLSGPVGGGSLSERPAFAISPPMWRPAADVCEAARALVVTVEIAGIDPDSVELVLFDDALIVAGNRRVSLHDRGDVYHAAEIRQGPFRLEVALPASIDPDRAEARYERGILRVTLPKLGGDGNGRAT